MFTVSRSDLLNPEFALIESAYKVLLFDEVPVLFSGENRFGNYIIGSSVFEDYEQNIERYFHIVVSPTDFRAFYAGKVSYLDLLKITKPIYVVDRQPGESTPSVGFVDFQNIPEQYRPTEHTFFPESAREPSITYSTKIKGGSADYHLADAGHVGIIQNQITSVLQKSLHALQTRLGFSVQTQLSPATASSYGINYVITLSEPPLFASEDRLLKFVNNFTEFCLDDLPNEIDSLLNRNEAPNTQFQSLFSEALELAPILAKNEEDLAKRIDEFKEDLRKDVLAVPHLLGPVAEIIQNSYGSLEINNENLPLGTVNEDFTVSLNRILAKLNEETVDSKIRAFRIRVYSYNKHTGKGRADVLIKDEVSQILVHVLDISLDVEEVNPYIESMRTDNYISVSGQMTYHGKRPYRLEI